MIKYDVKTALKRYQFAERLKSELIIASTMLQKSAKGEDLLPSFFDALLKEIRIAHAATGSKELSDAEMKIMECSGSISANDYERANKCIAEALSLVTTLAQRSAEILKSAELL
jgi:predicted PolB exonuclease-like 3'-5' exonuclease